MSEKYTPQDLQDNLAYLEETKSLIKQAIIDKEQPINESDTFRSYADKIRAIETGIKTEDATATASDLFYPKTAYTANGKITGQVKTLYKTMNPTLNTLTRTTYDTSWCTTSTNRIVACSYRHKLALFSNGSTVENYNVYAPNYVFFELNSNNVWTRTNYKISTSDIGFSGYCFVSADIAYWKNDDGTLRFGFVVQNVPNSTVRTLIVDYDYDKKEVVKIYNNSTELPRSHCGVNGVGNTWDGGIKIKFNPMSNNSVIMYGRLGYYSSDYGYAGFIANGVYTVTTTGTSEGRCISWNSQGSKCILSTIGAARIYTVSANAQTISHTAINSTIMDNAVAAIFKDSYYVTVDRATRDFSLYDLNTSSLIQTTTVPFSMNTLNGIYVATFNDYVFISDINNSYIYKYSVANNTLTKVTTATPYAIPNFGNGGDPSSSGWGAKTLYTFFRVEDNIWIENPSQAAYLIMRENGETVVDNIKIDESTMYNTNEDTATAANILSGKTAHSADGALQGTMPNNGSLSYTPTDYALSIPKGYTSGGTVRAANIANLNEYAVCLHVANEILGEKEITPYVKSGLTLSLNAKYNFDGSKWTDDVNSSRYATVYSGESNISSTSNGIQFNGGEMRTCTLNQYEGTYEIYAKITSTGITNSWFKNQSTIMGSLYAHDTANTCDWGITMLDTECVSLSGPGSRESTTASTFALNDGKYHHLVAVVTRTSSKLYADGELVASRSYSNSAGDKMQANFGIMWNNFQSGNAVKGIVRRIRAYNRSLSLEEIKQNYQSVRDEWEGV